MKNSQEQSKGSSLETPDHPKPPVNNPPKPTTDSSAEQSLISSPRKTRQRASSKKSLDEIRKDAAGGGEGAKEEKPKAKRGKKIKKQYTPEEALALCKFPFTAAEALTNFPWEMNPKLEFMVGMSAAEVLNEFGIEIFHKWLMLAMFIASYGTACFMWFKDYRTAIDKAVAAQGKKKIGPTDTGKPEPEPAAAGADTK